MEAPAVAAKIEAGQFIILRADEHGGEVAGELVVIDPGEEAARIMVENKIGCLPVMRDCELDGLITETDIFETFVEVLGGEGQILAGQGDVTWRNRSGRTLAVTSPTGVLDSGRRAHEGVGGRCRDHEANRVAGR
mgnify:CR=1 FL=1